MISSTENELAPNSCAPEQSESTAPSALSLIERTLAQLKEPLTEKLEHARSAQVSRDLNPLSDEDIELILSKASRQRLDLQIPIPTPVVLRQTEATQFPAKFLAWQRAPLPAHLQLPDNYLSTAWVNHPYVPTLLHQWIVSECEPVPVRNGMKVNKLLEAFQSKVGIRMATRLRERLYRPLFCDEWGFCIAQTPGSHGRLIDLRFKSGSIV